MLVRLDVAYSPAVLEPAPLFPDEAWADRNEVLCPTCKSVRRSRYPTPCDVVLSEPPEDQAMALVESTRVTIFRKDLLDLLRPHLSLYTFGVCLLSDGSLIDAYATCYRRDYIILRGGRYSSYAICPACGALFSNLGNGPEYVLASQLREGLIQQDVYCRLYLSEDLAAMIDIDPWVDLCLTAIPVRDEPMDGKTLPGDARSA